ncbi:Uncharacterised protein g3777 [Pycnogonum litorale]
MKGFLTSNKDLHRLKDGSNSVGGHDCDIFVDDCYGQVAKLIFDSVKNKLILHDTGIGKGTLLNECLLSDGATQIVPGDIIRFLPDKRCFKFRLADSLESLFVREPVLNRNLFSSFENVDGSRFSSSLPTVPLGNVDDISNRLYKPDATASLDDGSHQLRTICRNENSANVLRTSSDQLYSGPSVKEEISAGRGFQSSSRDDLCMGRPSSECCTLGLRKQFASGHREGSFNRRSVSSVSHEPTLPKTISRSADESSFKSRNVFRKKSSLVDLVSSCRLLPDLPKSPTSNRNKNRNRIDSVYSALEDNAENVSDDFRTDDFGDVRLRDRLRLGRASLASNADRTNFHRRECYGDTSFDGDSKKSFGFKSLDEVSDPRSKNYIPDEVDDSSVSDNLACLRITVMNKQRELKRLQNAIASITVQRSDGDDGLKMEVERMRKDKRIVTSLIKEAHKEMARKDNTMKMIVMENKHLRKQLASVRSTSVESDPEKNDSKRADDGHSSDEVLLSVPTEATEETKHQNKFETVAPGDRIDVVDVKEESESSIPVEVGATPSKSAGDCSSGEKIETIADDPVSDVIVVALACEELSSCKSKLQELTKILEDDSKENMYLKLDLEGAETRCGELERLLEEKNEEAVELAEYREAELKVVKMLEAIPGVVRNDGVQDGTTTLGLLQKVFNDLVKDNVKLKKKFHRIDSGQLSGNVVKEVIVTTVDEIENRLQEGKRCTIALNRELLHLESTHIHSSFCWILELISKIYRNELVSWRNDFTEDVVKDLKALEDKSFDESINVVLGSDENSENNRSIEIQATVDLRETACQTDVASVEIERKLRLSNDVIKDVIKNHVDLLSQVKESFAEFDSFVDRLRTDVTEGVNLKCEQLKRRLDESENDNNLKGDEIKKHSRVKFELEKAYRECCGEMKRLVSELNRTKNSLDVSERNSNVSRAESDEVRRANVEMESELNNLKTINGELNERLKEESEFGLRNVVSKKYEVIRRQSQQLKKLRMEVTRLGAEHDVDASVSDRLRNENSRLNKMLGSKAKQRDDFKDDQLQTTETEKLSLVGSFCLDERHLQRLKKFSDILNFIRRKLSVVWVAVDRNYDGEKQRADVLNEIGDIVRNINKISSSDYKQAEKEMEKDGGSTEEQPTERKSLKI